MRQLAIIIVTLWGILSASVITSKWIGQMLNAPMLEYDGYLVDVNTGMAYNMLLTQSTNALEWNLITIVPSPNNNYSMRLDRTNRSYSISVFDESWTLVAQRLQDNTYRYEDGVWADDTHVLVRRREGQFEGTIEFLLLDVLTNQDRVIATTNSIFYYQSPQNNWLLLNPQVAGEGELVSIWDDRRISLNYVASNTFGWSLADRYFASRTSVAGSTQMQIVNTQSGDIILHEFAPDLLRWSPMHQYLLVADESTIRLYRETNLLLEQSFPDTLIFSLSWASDGNHALARIRTDNNQTHIAILNTHPVINPTVDYIALPQNTALSSVQFTGDSAGIIYLTHPTDDTTEVYYLSLFDQHTTHIITLSQRIGQVEFITDVTPFLRHLNE